MNSQERELIQSVFDRLSHMAGAPKDAEAEALIAERLRTLPDGAYNLVQAVVMQELTLKQAQAHITEIERQLAEARKAVPPAAPAGAGGFLPGGAPNPWGQSAARSAIPQVPPQQQYAQPPQYAQPQQVAQPQQFAPPPASAWGQPAAQGGGFLRNAATAAAGVAGGVLLAEGISSLFSGGHRGGFGGGGGFAGGGGHMPANETVTENTTVNNYYGAEAVADDQADASADTQSVAYDDSGDFGGGDFGGDSEDV
jgi:hypothetical protein